MKQKRSTEELKSSRKNKRKASGGSGGLENCPFRGWTLAHPLKLEFVEKERKLKSLLFRQFIYVNLGIAGKVCQNLPFACKNA